MAFFLLAAVGCRVSQTTCVFHGSEVLRFRRNPFWRGLAGRFYRKNVDQFAVTTRYVEASLRDSGLLPRGANVVLAPCALPTVFHVEHSIDEEPGFKEAPETEVQSAREGEAIFRVLTVARLHPRKGQLEVARALGMLPAAQRERLIYQMVGVGEASYRAQVEEACRAGGVRWEFLGNLDDRTLGEVYKKATVYAQASRTLAQSVEGFGITFLEAGNHGCPVAAWRAGGVAEAVLDGETGLLVDEGDLAGLAAAVGRLLEDELLRVRLGEQGRKHITTFSWETSAHVLCVPPGKRLSKER